MNTFKLTLAFAISLFAMNITSAQSFMVKPKNTTKTEVKKSDRELTVEELNKILSSATEETKSKKSDEDLSEKYSYLTEQLINVANDYKGVRYSWGGMSRSGMDCSGFVKTAFDHFDINLPRTSREMASLGNKISKNDAKPGDLVFFKNGRSRVINHVGIVVEVKGDEIFFIHSATSKGVTVNSTKEPYYSKGFVQVNRVYDQQIL
nr:C40 family peptidase [uncultured Flavobacterium sp.]